MMRPRGEKRRTFATNFCTPQRLDFQGIGPCPESLDLCNDVYARFYKWYKAEMTIRGLLLFIFIVINGLPLPTLAESPNCASADGYPTSMAFVYLKNAGLIDNNTTDFKKTKVIRLASEKIGRDLYRQIHHISFTEKSGNIIEVITSNDASNVECSMSGVTVFVISRHLGE
jgi:hypothetical protein